MKIVNFSVVALLTICGHGSSLGIGSSSVLHVISPPAGANAADYVNGYYWSYLRGSASAGAGANGTSYSNVGDVTMSAVARRRHQRRLNHELFQAIYVRNLERVKDLIEKGADVNARRLTDSGAPLHLAARSNWEDLGQVLLSNGADVESRDSGGRSPLYVASQFNSPSVAQLLVSSSNENDTAVLDARDVLGRTPLHIAASHDAAQVAEILLCENMGSPANADPVDNLGRTPLHFAAATNSQRIAELLLAHGADVNAVDAIKGSTPLHYAAKKNAASVGQLLMLKGANATSPDEDGNTPLDVARSYGSKDIGRALRQRSDLPEEVGNSTL